ncbi:MAG: phage portal protein [Acidobacteria bacterium]|nr:phage portal protein [Acidobacteriota bacterium]MCA1620698.1 phage portal protein [Acidobacteriota bacterium]
MNEYLSRVLNSIRGLFGGARDKAMEQVRRITRQTMIASALSYYSGYAPKQLKVKDGEPDDNVYINYAEVVVDKGVGFLFGKPLVIGVGTDEDKSGEEYLEKVWPQAQRDEEFQEMAQDGAVTGDAYLKICIEPDGRPRVTVGDPATYEIVTDPHDVSRPVTFRCSYQMTDGAGREYLFKEETTRNEGGKSWRIRHFESRDGGNLWTPTEYDVTWNNSFPPIFHAKNLPNPKCTYGKPDLTEDVLAVIAYISRLDSMCGKVVRMHSSPKPYAKNLKKQDLEWGTDGMLFLKPTGTTVAAELGLLEMKNDISTALSLRKVLREGLAEMTGVPEVATGKVETTGQLSSVALRLLYGPLIEKTEKKQLRYGRMIKECVEALLVIGGIKNQKVKLNWGDALPGDEKAKMEVAETKLRIGYSQNTVIKETGGDPEHEARMRTPTADDMGSQILGAFDRGVGAEPVAGNQSGERDPAELAKLVEAVGALIRAGFKPEGALAAVGLDPIEHLGLLPITLRDEEQLTNATV